MDEVDGPKLTDPETVIRSEQEVATLLQAFRELAARSPDEAVWWDLTRRMVLVALGAGLRRGELLGLRWRDLDMLERQLHVRQSWVRNEMATPKMDAAVGNPNAYVQAKAGHSQFSITERYIPAAQTAFPGAVERAEERLFQEMSE